MLSSQIKSIVENDSVLNRSPFLGVVSKDNLPSPSTIRRRAGVSSRGESSWPTLIINSGKEAELGEHWLLCRFTPDVKYAYWFDSLGRELDPAFLSWFRQCGGVQWIGNRLQFQPLRSKLCGLYCLMVWRALCLGWEFVNILELLNKIDVEENERLVKEYCYRYFDIQADRLLSEAALCKKCL